MNYQLRIGPALQRKKKTKVAISGIGLKKGMDIILKRDGKTWTGKIPKEPDLCNGVSYAIVTLEQEPKSPFGPYEGDDLGSVTVTVKVTTEQETILTPEDPTIVVISDSITDP